MKYMVILSLNPPTDRPFETITNFNSQMPIGLVHTWWYHLNSVGTWRKSSLPPWLGASWTTIQTHSNGFEWWIHYTWVYLHSQMVSNGECTTQWVIIQLHWILVSLYVWLIEIKMLCLGVLGFYPQVPHTQSWNKLFKNKTCSVYKNILRKM